MRGFFWLLVASLAFSPLCQGGELQGYPNAAGGRDWFYGARPIGRTEIDAGGVKRFVPWRRYGRTVPVVPYGGTWSERRPSWRRYWDPH